MEKLMLEVSEHNNESKVFVLGVGKVRLFVNTGHIVRSGEVIGELYQLGKTFTLILPNGCQGQVKTLCNNEKIFNVEYKTPLMSLSSIEQIDEKNKDNKEAHKEFTQAITSPMDGMLYLSPSPSDPSFVYEDQEIHPGETVALIEVMKCFYPVKYKGVKKAKVKKIIVKNSSLIKSGQAIMEIN